MPLWQVYCLVVKLWFKALWNGNSKLLLVFCEITVRYVAGYWVFGVKVRLCREIAMKLPQIWQGPSVSRKSVAFDKCGVIWSWRWIYLNWWFSVSDWIIPVRELAIFKNWQGNVLKGIEIWWEVLIRSMKWELIFMKNDISWYEFALWIVHIVYTPSYEVGSQWMRKGGPWWKFGLLWLEGWSLRQAAECLEPRIIDDGVV